jgi:hypothetical protein
LIVFVIQVAHVSHVLAKTANPIRSGSNTTLQTRATHPGSFEAFRWHGPVPFEDPIILPAGSTLRTPRGATSYIMALPGKTRQSDEWQAAIEALLMAAEDRGPLIMRASACESIEPKRRADVQS